MSKTLKIASKLPMALRISEPHPNPERPGDSPELKTAVINGTNAPGSGAEAVTEVDADLYRAWAKANPAHVALVGGSFREMGKDEELDDASQFGFEPGLKAIAGDKDNTKAAAEGSTVKGAVTAKDMAATSDTPNDDSPRSQTNAPVSAAQAAPIAAAPVSAPNVAKK